MGSSIRRDLFRRLVAVGVLLSALAMSALPSAAQSGRVTGTVRDALGRALSGARVRLESPD